MHQVSGNQKLIFQILAIVFIGSSWYLVAIFWNFSEEIFSKTFIWLNQYRWKMLLLPLAAKFILLKQAYIPGWLNYPKSTFIRT